MEKVDLAEKFGKFTEAWSPKIVGELDDYDIKIARLEGEFIWHSHADSDEMFFVIEGVLTMCFRDREVEFGAGEFLVVPRGVEHKPVAAAECKVLLLERKGTVNTGDATDSERTVTAPERI